MDSIVIVLYCARKMLALLSLLTLYSCFSFLAESGFVFGFCVSDGMGRNRQKARAEFYSFHKSDKIHLEIGAHRHS